MNNMSIEQLINEALRPKEKRPINSWHPSALGSCLTGAYLNRLGVEPDKELDERVLRIFSVGKQFEDWLVNLIKESGATIETQKRIEWPEMDVTGYVDLIIDEMPVEIKTKHSKSFWYMTKQGAPRQNQMQLWVYLKVLNVKVGRLVFLSKDDLAVQEYPVYLEDEQLANEVINELTILNRAWEEKLPPPPIEDPKDWRYKFCRFHLQCLNFNTYLQI